MANPTTYDARIDTLLGTFRSAWNATGVRVVYEWTEADLKTHPRNSGNPWARIVVRHNDAMQASLPNEVGQSKWRRYGVVWIQIFVPAAFGSAWTQAQDFASIAQAAYEGHKDPDIVYTKAIIQDKERDGAWVRKDVKAYFYWDELQPERLPAISVPILSQAPARALLGLNMGVTLTRFFSLNAPMQVGLIESARPSVIKPLAPISMALGLTESASIEKSVLALHAAMNVGLTEAATIRRIKNLSVPITLGLTEAATVKRQKNLTAAMVLGLTEAAAVSTTTPTLTGSYTQTNTLNNNASATKTFTAQAIGAANAKRYVYVIVTYINSAAITLNTVTIGGVTATQQISSGASGDGTAEIWSALVPTGTTATVVLNFSSTFTLSTSWGVGIDMYRVVASAGAPANTDSYSDATLASPSKAFTMAANGFLIVGGAESGVSRTSSGVTTDNNFTQYVAGKTAYAGSSQQGSSSGTTTWSGTGWSGNGVRTVAKVGLSLAP